MARLTSYQLMARDLGIPFCGGMLRTGHYCPRDHRLNGSVVDGTIHFTERPVTKADTLAFLKRAAEATEPELAEDVPWRRVYRRDRIARDLGTRLRIRLPARYWSMDKAFVLAGVAGLTNDVPLRRQAYDWARR